MALDLDRIRKSARRVRKFVKRNPKRPNSRTVHRVRTGARHLESALVTMELTAKRGVGSLLQDLRKIYRLTGAVRDMDVLTAAALQADGRGEQDCLVQLLEYLGAERGQRAHKLRSAIAKRQSDMLRGLERGLERVEKAAAEVRGGGNGTVRGAVTRAVEFSTKLSRPGRLTRNNLHGYRSQVKELRDILRLSHRSADSKLVRKLEDVKTAIGDWHDWDELTKVASKALDHGHACVLMKRLTATRDEKYERALAASQTLITRHLRTRLRKRAKRPAPVAKPVLEAVAAIQDEATH